MAAIPYLEAAAAAFAGGGSSTQGTLNLQGPYPLPGFNNVEHRGRRRLQAAGEECQGDFTVSSLLWPGSAGCYADDPDGSIFEYTVGRDTYVIASIPMYNSADSPSVWVAGQVIGVIASDAATLDPHCHSEGDITVHPHPADVEFWLCDIDNTGTAYTEMTTEQFSTECGCDAAGELEDPATTAPATTAPAAPSTPAPVAATRDLGTPAPAAAALPPEAPTPAEAAATLAPATAEAAPTPAAGAAETLSPVAAAEEGASETPAPTAAATTPSEDASVSVTSDTPQGLCGEIQPLTVVTTESLLAELEGCYEETGHEYHEEGGHFFNITGSHLRGQMAVFPGYVDAESMDPRWFLGFVGVTTAETLIYCVSAQPPSAGHPSTANWYCDDGSGAFPLKTDDEFNVLCGCGEAITPPDVGEATEPPAHESAHDGATEPAGTTPPAAGGATEHPSHMASFAPTPTPAAAIPERSSAPVAVAATEGPVAGHSTSASEHSEHATSASDQSEHTTSAAEEGHTTSAHSGNGDHSGTPSPTTVARGIIGASATPAPTSEDFEPAAVSAATRPATAVTGGVTGLGVVLIRAVLAVGVAAAAAW